MAIPFLAFRRTAILLLSLGIFAGQGSSGALAQAGKPGSLAGAVPSGAVGYAEVSGLGGLLSRIQESSYLQTVTSSPQFQALEKLPQYKKGLAVKKIVETQLGMDLWKAFESLLADRLAVAVYLKGEGGNGGPGGQDVVALLRGVDAKVLAQFRERVEPLLTLIDDQPAEPEMIQGARVISIKGKLFAGVGDTWLVAASTRDLLMKVLTLQSGNGKGALTEDEPFQAMTAHMGGEHLVRAYVNTDLVAKVKGSRLVPEKLDNPLASILLGGLAELGGTSPFAGVTLDVQEDRFVLASGVAGDSRKLDEAHRVFFSDPSNPGTPAVPQLPGLIGGFTFYLDLANWYKQREKLLDAAVLPGFDKFETGIANLLPGKDVGQDVVPLLGKNLLLVAAPQDYMHLEGRPGVKLPGFALVLELAKPDEGADILQLFFQTISSILNIQAGQQNRQPWVMSSETFKDVQISYGRYLKKPTGDQLPLVFNFMPAAARVGDKFIISSSLGLCRQLIEDLQKPSDKQRPNRNLNLELYPQALSEILQANQGLFEAQAIQKGKDAKQAVAEFSTILQLLRSFQAFRLSTTVKPESFQVQLEGSWK